MTNEQKSSFAQTLLKLERDLEALTAALDETLDDGGIEFDDMDDDPVAQLESASTWLDSALGALHRVRTN